MDALELLLTRSSDNKLIEPAPTGEALDNILNAGLRAPMMIIGICKYKEHEKVPRVEQIATTACAIQNMQMAAFAQGFNGIWRTGVLAHHEAVKQALNLEQDDEIVGYLYLGTPENPTHIKRQKGQQDFVEFWS